MSYIPMEKLIKNKNNSVYKLTILAARRALELGAGSEKLVEAAPNEKLTTIAFREIEQDKISYKKPKK